MYVLIRIYIMNFLSLLLSGNHVIKVQFLIRYAAVSQWLWQLLEIYSQAIVVKQLAMPTHYHNRSACPLNSDEFYFCFQRVQVVRGDTNQLSFKLSNE